MIAKNGSTPVITQTPLGNNTIRSGSHIINHVVEERNAGTAVLQDGDRRNRRQHLGYGGEVRGEVDANREGDEESSAEEQHLVAAEVPAGHAHGDEQHHTSCHHAEVHGA